MTSRRLSCIRSRKIENAVSEVKYFIKVDRIKHYFGIDKSWFTVEWNTESRSVDLVIRMSEINVLKCMTAVRLMVKCGLFPPAALMSTSANVRGWRPEDMTQDL